MVSPREDLNSMRVKSQQSLDRRREIISEIETIVVQRIEWHCKMISGEITEERYEEIVANLSDRITELISNHAMALADYIDVRKLLESVEIPIES
jgi:hypothetical protein